MKISERMVERAKHNLVRHSEGFSRNPAFVLSDLLVLQAANSEMELSENFYPQVEQLAKYFREMVDYVVAEKRAAQSLQGE